MHQFRGESLNPCGPARENGDATAMVAPAKPGGSARIQQSNLDSTGLHFVRKGAVVAFHCVRYRVLRVRLGYWYGSLVDAFGRVHADCVMSGPCTQSRVVA